MSQQEILASVRNLLNAEGQAWNLHFQVSDQTLPDGEWLQLFVMSDATRRNAAAEQQIISDVEEELSQSSGQELLLVKVSEFVPASSSQQ
jgi:hypothetical protein